VTADDTTRRAAKMIRQQIINQAEWHEESGPYITFDGALNPEWIAEALADAGLLAPAPLREEWRAFSPARGMESPEPTLSAALDEVEGQHDLTEMDPGAFGTERDWRVERRLTSPWLPVGRAEGDGRAEP